MSVLQEKFRETGLKQNFAAKKLGVTEKTISRWMNMEGIDSSIKFIEFLYFCDVCPIEFFNNYQRMPKYKCVKQNCSVHKIE
jgi:transcriptional regulator with XRE-family HTH domain